MTTTTTSIPATTPAVASQPSMFANIIFAAPFILLRVCRVAIHRNRSSLGGCSSQTFLPISVQARSCAGFRLVGLCVRVCQPFYCSLFYCVLS